MGGKGQLLAAALLAATVQISSALGDDLNVVSISPGRHALTAPMAARISVTFDRAVNRNTVSSVTFRAFGRWSGPVSGNFSYSNGDQTVTLSSPRPFLAGDLVQVFLSDGLAAADGSLMRPAGYAWHFWVKARQAAMTFNEIDVFTNRIDNIQTRIYGAAAVDLNGDGRLDLTTVNEVSEDVRVFLNTGNPSDPYAAFLAPHPISFEASPNDTGDFNNDGKADVCIAASGTSTVWVLLGAGNGTFQPPGQEIPVPDAPHGIAVLDADGDGDTDVATSNTGGGNVAVLLNNGSGVFGAPSTFEGGGTGEYAIGAGDMNNDGIMDLVVGCISFPQRVVVHLGNGDGTFTNHFTQNAGGDVWMIALGDVNGDGNMDVSSANSGSNSGSILLGNGTGSLALPLVTPTGQHTVATDLGDLDGDGDLDWVLSAFGGGIWRVYRNNGAGSFAFDEEFDAPANPSCAIILDFDNDRDLDLMLTDEIADVLIAEQNSGVALIGDFATDGDVDTDDYNQFASCYTGPGGSYPPSCELGDFDGDGDIDCDDWSDFEQAWTTGQPPELAQCAEPVPAVGTWGVVTLALVLASAGMIMISRPRAAVSEPRP